MWRRRRPALENLERLERGVHDESRPSDVIQRPAVIDARHDADDDADDGARGARARRAGSRSFSSSPSSRFARRGVSVRRAASTEESDADARERARLESADAFGELVAMAAKNGVVVEEPKKRSERGSSGGGDVRTDERRVGDGRGRDDGGERRDKGTAAGTEETAVVAAARAEWGAV